MIVEMCGERQMGSAERPKRFPGLPRISKKLGSWGRRIASAPEFGGHTETWGDILGRRETRGDPFGHGETRFSSDARLLRSPPLRRPSSDALATFLEYPDQDSSLILRLTMNSTIESFSIEKASCNTSERNGREDKKQRVQHDAMAKNERQIGVLQRVARATND